MQQLLRNRALPWVLLFLAICFMHIQVGGINPASRIAGLRAITEGHTLHFDKYKSWTGDWSKAPNGHYYPNKAPGGVLLGLPFFFLIDTIYNAVVNPPWNAEGQRLPPTAFELTIFSMLTQFLPFALLVLYAAAEFEAEMGPMGTNFFAIAALFGNTAAIYMTTYFGHGLAATLMLACFITWLKRRYSISGLFISAAFLTEYGTGFVIPFFLIGTMLRERSWRPCVQVALGSLPCAALWIWYHQTAFGSPFVPAIRFSNPAMIASPDHGGGFWGMIGIIPHPFRINKLLFGPERGLIYTQPWLLATFPFFFVRTRLPRGTQLFLCGGLCALLWMNSSIGGWDGGWALGPRYLSQLFPALALAFALSWPQLSGPWRVLLSLGLALSVVFRVMVLPFLVIAPPVNLWYLHWTMYSGLPFDATQFLTLFLALLGFSVAGSWAVYRERRQ